ncbi:ribosomal RNA small subunit methyltransferase A [Candidatus Peregrinibacteria bacterium]|jgi:16S rRNA (adenine1518-N6/adenine1519-N6)-dimethyltransferase|nr:ribosomal RNA small subunit methyltransferase A [Candidatus Peregrinibacteria bacterium]MBT3599156.1 ribosomal RNA small subunit methyltransferase A [Candidatus Peregrinibacteria bacterium]MBT6730796.1 ribosomal RNA small subunit methyltransferase A [Candidatus Peregrinibacteria bacterium]MBT7008872.1 ribosomal RNA small subunit methyltransferase A [Candidatus Peregrinibacteria bacterium]MBT7344617.1 ribosomal RNA small subunit methyltransferase A [Candidatus Peregrinibacteria bacterium]
MNTLQEFLHTNGIKLNTDLGQHFLSDEKVLSEILEAANVSKEDTVVEIGPGVGVLTKELLELAKNVTAIELDARFIRLLKIYTGNNPNLNVIQGNALNVDLPKEPYKIVANIPYHITSPLLHHAFLESEVYPKSMTLLIQREVAEKICNKKNAGILTILVNLFGTPRIVTHVAPKSFIPPPKVKSSVLHIDCFDKPLVDNETIENIFRLTKIAFSQKRKKISNGLGKQPNATEYLAKAGIDLDRRPDTISTEEWIELGKIWKN